MTLSLLALLPLLACGVSAGAVPLLGKASIGNITLDNGLSRGVWGPVELCAEGSYVFDFEIKYSGLGFFDDTCVNAIRLYCQTLGGELTGLLVSAEGTYGQWRGLRSCPSGEFYQGMRANVVPDQGTFGDDLGMDNLQMRCSGGKIMDGLYGTPAKGQGPAVARKLTKMPGRVTEAIHMKFRQSAQVRDFGDWGTWANCPGSSKVCGLQVRLEDNHPLDDDAGITDVVMFCCN